MPYSYRIRVKSIWAIRKLNLSVNDAQKNQILELHKLIEISNEAFENSKICKAKMKKFHDKNFGNERISKKLKGMAL